MVLCKKRGGEEEGAELDTPQTELTKIEVLTRKHFADNIPIKANHYLVCIENSFCSCLSHLWDGPIRDLCHHQHAVKLFLEAEESEDLDKIRTREKLPLINYFRSAW